eukprot:Skav217953  [mRNA]  locus=scaffold3202:104607:119428:+ [translate_table: standard]
MTSGCEVSRKRIQSTPLHVYQSSMGLGEGWEGKFRGLVLEAIWPLVFGATDWEPTQVEYLPTLSAEANNRARAGHLSDREAVNSCTRHGMCRVRRPGGSFLVDVEATSMDGASEALKRKKARHLIFSCTQRAEYCERQLQSGQNTSMLWLKERERFKIYDPMGIVPWYMKAKLRPVLYGLSLWWPRNSFQAHRNLHAVSDKGYAPMVVELNSPTPQQLPPLVQRGCIAANQGSVQLPENDLASEAERREFGTQVARDVAVWMVLAFAAAGTDLAPYLIYAGGFSVAFALCYQIYLAVKKPR